MADRPGDDAAPATLPALVDALERWSGERDGLAAAAVTGLPARADWPELPALAEFRALWAQLRTRDQVRRALAPAPGDAGPLNSRALVHRMLRLMQHQSPGYLRHFTAYVDVLAGLDELQAGSAASRRDAAAGGAAEAPARARAKTRRPRAAERVPRDRD